MLYIIKKAGVMKKKYLILLIIIVIASALLFFYLRHSFHPKNHQKTSLVTVLVSKVKQQDVNVETSTVGTVEAYSTVEIKSQIEGQLLSVNFNEGEMVKKGEVLFKIDPRPFQALLAQAKANLERDLASLD